MIEGLCVLWFFCFILIGGVVFLLQDGGDVFICQIGEIFILDCFCYLCESEIFQVQFDYLICREVFGKICCFVWRGWIFLYFGFCGLCFFCGFFWGCFDDFVVWIQVVKFIEYVCEGLVGNIGFLGKCRQGFIVFEVIVVYQILKIVDFFFGWYLFFFLFVCIVQQG